MSDRDEEPQQLENEFQVSKAEVVDLRSSRKLSHELVVVISTKEWPEHPPFHFRIEEDQLRNLVAQAGRHFDPSRQERHEILESLARIELLLAGRD